MTGSEVVEKRNCVNNIVFESNMSLQALRLFAIYLGKINARNSNTREIVFTVNEMQTALNVKKIKLSDLDRATSELLHTIAHIPYDDGFRKINLFSSCEVRLNDKKSRIVRMRASEEAMPLFFNYKDEYLTYSLKEALLLKSVTSFRLFELLSQYKHVGKASFRLDELKEKIYLEDKTEVRWGNFEARVLKGAKRLIETYTSLHFSYKPIKQGRGDKVVAVAFKISMRKQPSLLCGNA